MNRDSRHRLLTSIALLGFAAMIHAQQNPGAPGGAQPGFQRRLNAPAQPAEGNTNQNAGTYDPLAFYRKNPELMKRYFPHLAQGQPGAGGSGAPGQLIHDTSQRELVVLDSFKFPGGTAADFADILKMQLNPPPNIIIAPKLRETQIPEFELKNVTLEDLFQALNNLSEDKSVQWQLSGSTEPIWVLNPMPGTAPAAATQPGFGMHNPFGVAPGAVDPVTGMPMPSANNGRICQILPLGKYLAEYKVEDITTAVKTAWSMMGDDAGAQLKYHTDTKLLIAVGTSAQLGILTQVLSSLESGMEHKRKTTEMSDIPIPANKSSRNF